MGIVSRWRRRSSGRERRSRKSDKRRGSIRGRKIDCSSSGSSGSSGRREGKKRRSGRREGEKEKKRKRRRSDVRRRNNLINEEASETNTKLHVSIYEKFEELR